MMNAEYCKMSGLDGNPMIEAIVGRISSNKRDITRLLYKPIDWDGDFSSLGTIETAMKIKRIREIFIPMKVHLRLYEELTNMVLQSYLVRNPVDSIYKKKLNQNTLGNTISTREFSTILLCGESGLGKSYTVQRILESIGTEAILHTNYEGHQLSLIQIPFIIVNMNSTGSIKTLMLDILKEIDAKSSTNYYSESVSKRFTDATLVNLLSKIVLGHSVGCIIIDELQMVKNISRLTSFLTNLINKVSTTFLFIATPVLYYLLDDFAVVRRLSTEAFIEIEEMSRAEYHFFLSELFKYQVKDSQHVLTETLFEYYYAKTGGNTDLTFKFYLKMLSFQVKNDLITVSISDYDKIYSEEFKLLREKIDDFKEKRENKGNHKTVQPISKEKKNLKLESEKSKVFILPEENYGSYKEKGMINQMEWCLC